MDREEAKEKLVELLKDKGFKYREDDDGWFVVDNPSFAVIITDDNFNSYFHITTMGVSEIIAGYLSLEDFSSVLDFIKEYPHFLSIHNMIHSLKQTADIDWLARNAGSEERVKSTLMDLTRYLMFMYLDISNMKLMKPKGPKEQTLLERVDHTMRSLDELRQRLLDDEKGLSKHNLEKELLKILRGC